MQGILEKVVEDVQLRVQSTSAEEGGEAGLSVANRSRSMHAVRMEALERKHYHQRALEEAALLGRSVKNNVKKRLVKKCVPMPGS